jgi:hypothetical protein
VRWVSSSWPGGWHDHGAGKDHAHLRADEPHRHNRNAKTYFRGETRSDGMPVKCEGHWSVELEIIDDWAYEKGAFA